ncbi:hypothetical protein MBLNU13_g10568t1 [Cladosporium sp. NU13]
MSLWQSYRALAPRTRLFIGGGIMAYAAFGLLASDQAEQLLGWTATEEDRKRLKEEMPKVHVVDRFNKDIGGLVYVDGYLCTTGERFDQDACGLDLAESAFDAPAT